MKLVRITLDLVVENDTRADKWVYEAICDNLYNDNEDIVDFQYNVLSEDYKEFV
jgi:hypothetical protein